MVRKTYQMKFDKASILEFPPKACGDLEGLDVRGKSPRSKAFALEGLLVRPRSTENIWGKKNVGECPKAN